MDAEHFTVEVVGEMHAKKIWKVQEMSLKMGAPCVGINDSGGARIQKLLTLFRLCGIFQKYRRFRCCSTDFCTHGRTRRWRSIFSKLYDFILMVKNTSQMFITGPAVIKSVTAGRSNSLIGPGGAMTHNTTSGVAHFAAENEDDCIEQIRYLLSFLPSNNMDDVKRPTNDDRSRMDEELNTVIP